MTELCRTKIDSGTVYIGGSFADLTSAKRSRKVNNLSCVAIDLVAIGSVLFCLLLTPTSHKVWFAH